MSNVAAVFEMSYDLKKLFFYEIKWFLVIAVVVVHDERTI